jgi:hypothetical protein
MQQSRPDSLEPPCDQTWWRVDPRYGCRSCERAVVQAIKLDRSTLADWVGHAAWYLRPLRDRTLKELRRSQRLFADETTAPVLDPARAHEDRPALGLSHDDVTAHGLRTTASTLLDESGKWHPDTIERALATVTAMPCAASTTVGNIGMSALR